MQKKSGINLKKKSSNFSSAHLQLAKVKVTDDKNSVYFKSLAKVFADSEKFFGIFFYYELV